MMRRTQASVLEAFRRAVDREAHTLARRPDLMFQQCVNRLQWEGPPARGVLRGWSARSDATPSRWMRTRTPFRESSELIRTSAAAAAGSCAICPDGSFVVSTSDRILKIWDTLTLTERSRLVGHTQYVHDCAVSPDGAFVVSASADWTVRIWDAADGSERATLEGHDGAVRACAIAPDGAFIVSASERGGLKVWEPSSGREMATLGDAGALGVTACALSPDGSFVVSASSEALKIWDIRAGVMRSILLDRSRTSWGTNLVCDCAVNPDGTLIVSANNNGTLTVWDVESERERMTLEAHKGRVTACVVSPDGGFIASAGYDGTVKVWDVATGEELATLLGHAGPVWDCAVSADGTLIVSAGSDGTLKTWEAPTTPTRRRKARSRDEKVRRDPPPLEGHGSGVNDCAFSPNGAFLVSASSDRTVIIWDEARMTTRSTLTPPRSEFSVDACAVAPDGTFIVSASTRDGHDETLTIWDAASAASRAVLEGHTGPPGSCAVSPEGSFIVSGGYRAKIWGLGTGKVEATLPQSARACAVGPDGSFVVLGDEFGSLQVWDVGGAKEISEFGHMGRARVEAHRGDVLDCAVSPDGTFIVSASRDETLKVWEVGSWRELRTLRGHGGRVDGCAVSPDAAFVASASADKTLRIWDVATGESTATLPLPGRLTCVALHPWIPRAACGDQGGTLYLIDLVGIEYRPIIVTAVDTGAGTTTLRCPRCFRTFEPSQSWLGGIMTCPTRRCRLRLRVNPFTAKPPSWDEAADRLDVPPESLHRPLPERPEAPRRSGPEAPAAIPPRPPSDLSVEYWWEVEDHGVAGRDMWLMCRGCSYLIRFNPGLGDKRPHECPRCGLRGSRD